MQTKEETKPPLDIIAEMLADQCKINDQTLRALIALELEIEKLKERLHVITNN